MLRIRGILTVVLAVALVAVVGCAPGSQGTHRDLTDADELFDGTIRFGATVSLTGKYAREGHDTRQGYDTWLNWVNNEHGGIRVGERRYRAEIVYYDDESEPGTAAALTDRLVTRDGVDFLLGPYSSALNASSSAIADRHQTIMVTGTASADSLFERDFRHFFSVMTVASRYTESALRVLAGAGARTVVVAHEDTEFPIDAGRGAVTHAGALGMEVLAVETYPRGVTDVSGIIAKFRTLEPDVFVGAGYFVDALLFARAAQEQGFAPDAMVLTVGPSNPAFADELGAAAELVIGPTQWEASMDWYGPWLGGSADYAARYGGDHGQAPTYQAAGATAAALVLQLAIERAGTTGTRAVREALMKLDIETFYGPVKFDHKGRNAAKLMGAIQIQEGGLELITPAEVATGRLSYPRGLR
jgi:branched-chain amino acid transport system substrate-binding protein